MVLQRFIWGELASLSAPMQITSEYLLHIPQWLLRGELPLKCVHQPFMKRKEDLYAGPAESEFWVRDFE